MYKPIFVTLSLLYCAMSMAQGTRQYNFMHYSTMSGLASNQINASLQDDEGFIWIASNNGLQRYDGIRYKSFRHKDRDSSSIPSNFVFQLLIDKKKNLWVLTLDGKAGIFNTRTFKFTSAAIKVKNEANLRYTSQFKKIIADDFGHLLLFIPNNEVLTYDEKTNEFSAAYNFFLQKPEWKITNFVLQPGTKKYWMCIQGEGLAIYNDDTRQLSYPGNNLENEKLIDQFKTFEKPSHLFFDKRGRLWFSNMIDGFPYVYSYDLKKQAFTLEKYKFNIRELGYHEVRGFFEQQDSTIWVIGQKIFAKYLEKEKQFEHVFNGFEEEHSIAFILVTKLAEDRERNLWVGTANNGLFRFNPHEEFFTNVKHISHATGQSGDGPPLSFAQDKDSSILVGIREDGLYRYDKNLKDIPLDIKGIADKNNVIIWDMYVSRSSNIIWMATENGIYRYNKLKRSAEFFHPPLLKTTIVRKIVEDQNGNLWLGTLDGVFKWNVSKDQTLSPTSLSAFAGIPANRINKIITDKKGLVWVGVFAEGAYVIDPATDSIVMHFHVKASGEYKLPEETVTSLVQYNDSLMVICTNTRIALYNIILKKRLLLGNPEIMTGFISSAETDNNGHLWVSTTSALYRITVRNRVFVQFNRDDGLANDFFVHAASRLLPDGRMLFGVSGSMIAFNPSVVNINTSFPDIRMTDFKAMNKALRIDSLLGLKEIELEPDQNSIMVDLSTMSYNSGYLLKYKMEKLDKEWQIADQNHQLIYSYLPAGSYTLLVNTIDAEGNTGKNTFKLNIRIKPPYWKTWWFYSLLVLLLGILLFWFDRQRMKRKETMQKMRSNIAGNLHREINIALNNINILSEMASLKADKDIQKSKEYIEQIHGKSGHMIIAMDDMLWSIDPANDNMQKTVERMREYIETLNNRHTTDIEMVVDRKVETLKLDMQLRHDALQLFKDSIKSQLHCGSTDIKIHIGYEKTNLVYTLQFNPETCNIEQLNNVLYSQEMTKRLKTIRAVLNMDLQKNHALLLVKVPAAV